MSAVRICTFIPSHLHACAEDLCLLFAPVISTRMFGGKRASEFSPVSCVLEPVEGLLNALQKAYSARLTAGLPGRRCSWTSHWVSQTFTLWIKQLHSDVKLSACICIPVCFTHCVITLCRSAGTENGSLTAEDVIYLFRGRSNKMWSVRQTDEVVCPNNMLRPYGWLYCTGRLKMPIKYTYDFLST